MTATHSLIRKIVNRVLTEREATPDNTPEGKENKSGHAPKKGKDGKIVLGDKVCKPNMDPKMDDITNNFAGTQ